jgi:hypothetical protein
VSNIDRALMTSRMRFRIILPASQIALAGLFGGWGLWQRNQILSHDYLFGIGWNTTARFHIWPWPFKFAVCVNFPAFLVGSLLSWPLGIAWPKIPEYISTVPSLIFVPILWCWVGSRLDRRWDTINKTPWIALSVFTLICLAGAFLPIGYVGFLPYGFVVWLFTTFAVSRGTHTCSGIPIASPKKAVSHD